ncbi:hypothetical protein IMZ48_49430 [Candidatus Bathyarchaeota archaeon]|nr:hypothetical protein [Candidatus Bathyarchaeota archaeon]
MPFAAASCRGVRLVGLIPTAGGELVHVGAEAHELADEIHVSAGRDYSQERGPALAVDGAGR